MFSELVKFVAILIAEAVGLLSDIPFSVFNVRLSNNIVDSTHRKTCTLTAGLLFLWDMKMQDLFGPEFLNRRNQGSPPRGRRLAIVYSLTNASKGLRALSILEAPAECFRNHNIFDG